MSEISYFFVITIGGLLSFFVIILMTKFFDTPQENEVNTHRYQYPDQLTVLKENVVQCVKKGKSGSFIILDFETYYLQF